LKRMSPLIWGRIGWTPGLIRSQRLRTMASCISAPRRCIYPMPGIFRCRIDLKVCITVIWCRPLTYNNYSCNKCSPTVSYSVIACYLFPVLRGQPCRLSLFFRSMLRGWRCGLPQPLSLLKLPGGWLCLCWARSCWNGVGIPGLNANSCFQTEKINRLLSGGERAAVAVTGGFFLSAIRRFVRYNKYRIQIYPPQN